MHDIKWIRENPAAFDRGLARRGLAPQAERVLAIDERRRAVIQKLEGAQARRNAASKEIGQAKAKKDEATAQVLMAEVAELKTLVPAMEAEEKEGSKKLDDALAEIPNLPLDEVPDGYWATRSNRQLDIRNPHEADAGGTAFDAVVSTGIAGVGGREQRQTEFPADQGNSHRIRRRSGADIRPIGPNKDIDRTVAPSVTTETDLVEPSLRVAVAV